MVALPKPPLTTRPVFGGFQHLHVFGHRSGPHKREPVPHLFHGS